MGKKYADSVLDAALNLVKTTATTLVYCSAEPANYAGIAAVALVTASGLISGDFAGPVDDTSGRKITVAAKTGLTPSANGTVTYAVLHDGATLLAGTPVTPQAVTTLQSWDSPEFKLAIGDPT